MPLGMRLCEFLYTAVVYKTQNVLFYFYNCITVRGSSDNRMCVVYPCVMRSYLHEKYTSILSLIKTRNQTGLARGVFSIIVQSTMGMNKQML